MGVAFYLKENRDVEEKKAKAERVFNIFFSLVGVGIVGWIIIASWFGAPTIQPSCDDPQIKGNISFTSHEKIYHVPGGQFYDKTSVDESQGEKWFCTEQEAQDAGFRKSSK